MIMIQMNQKLQQKPSMPKYGISYPEPEPNLFSFNSPYGACSFCNGLGINKIVDFEKVIPDKQNHQGR